MDNLRRRLTVSDDAVGAKSGSEANALDVLFSKNDGSLLAVFAEENWPNSGWTPIGIVLIPGSHNRYGDNSCGVMSIREMWPYTPEEGYIPSELTYDVALYVFDLHLNVSTLKEKTNSVSGKTNAYIPFEKNGSPGVTQYYSGAGSSTADFPKSYSSSYALGYYRGDLNNLRIIAYLDSHYSGWRTLNEYGSNTGNSEYTAAACCYRYHTIGTNQGDWYLPSCAEIAYLPSVRYSVADLIRRLDRKYNIGTTYTTNSPYLSSTSISNSNKTFWTVDVGTGLVYDSSYNKCVRAFMKYS